ncbi:MAG: flagellar assembly protein FliW [Oscillospiraceae bacterium]|nr:flagellar assembly protein FliW [Oscillospiraceae bacterium]
MKTQTRYFGEIEYTKEELLTFAKGLFGFEDEQEFLLIPFSNEGTLFSLQSVRTPELAFTLMHPFSLAPDYAPVLGGEELKTLGVEKSEDLYYYVMCTVREPVGESTVNMKCPVAINPDTRCGLQAILESAAWEMRHKLSEFDKQEDKTC